MKTISLKRIRIYSKKCLYLLCLGILLNSCKKNNEIKSSVPINTPDQTIVVPVPIPATTPAPVPVLPPFEFPVFSAEAHRGGRGLMPENSIIAMLSASKLEKVTTIEMDTHITNDGKVVVIHDDYLNPLIMLTPAGLEIPAADSKKYPIFKMNYDDINKFDLGTKFYKDFPLQKKVKTYIPLLSDLIDSVQNNIQLTNRDQLIYNIEIKSAVSGDNIVNPKPEIFVELLMNVIEDKNISRFVVIQSFDKRALQIINKKYPSIRTSFLVSNKKTYEENVSDLGFKPYILSPISDMVTLEMVTAAHADGVKIITWTVNSALEIKRLKNLNVDGIITDYPNLF
jgi:glycerophosphoryl diester phosphodiesterase